MGGRVGEKKPFKDWFDNNASLRLAQQVEHVWPEFSRAAFVTHATRNLKKLEFHGRVKQFANALAATLPESPAAALKILTDSLPEKLPDAEQVTDGWLQWPVGQFIADHGLTHFEESMNAMIE